MSNRDQNLVKALGIPVAQIAEAMNKSRQTVTRGVQLSKPNDDYFKPADLTTALSHWRANNAPLYALAKTKVCELYGDVASAIISAVESSSRPAFSIVLPGEYWLLCGDYAAFRSDLSVCAEQIAALASADDTQIVMFYGERDRRSALRWATNLVGEHGKEKVRPILCQDADLLVMPTSLLRIDDDDNIDLFGATDVGFVPLSNHEASRLRTVIRAKFLVPNPSAHALDRANAD